MESERALDSLHSPHPRHSAHSLQSQDSPDFLHSLHALGSVSDEELVRRLSELISRSRRVEADLVAHIGEVDARRLYAREAAPSMFVYCTQRLHLSEAEAYLRITVARAARQHPVLLAMLRDGRLHLSGIALLLPLLTRENCDTLLARATHRSKRQVEELVAELSPRPDAPTLMLKLPHRAALVSASDQAALVSVPVRAHGSEGAPAGGAELRPDGVVTPWPPSAAPVARPAPAPPPRAALEPLSPGRYKVQFTASATLRDKLERLQALMRSEVPDGDLAVVIERAVSEKLERLEARRYGSSAPRKSLQEAETSPVSRHVPTAVRRAVLERDGSRCGYVDEHGRRCPERERLEFHHRHPFGMGGDHSPGNLGLLCRAHNRLLAEHDYGRRTLRPASTGQPTSRIG